MTRIHKAFENGKAFISFITGGDPEENWIYCNASRGNL